MPRDSIQENPIFSSNIVSLTTSDNLSHSQSIISNDKDSFEFSTSGITSFDNNYFYTFNDSVDVILNCLLCQELVVIVSKLIKEETDTICSFSSQTETFVYAEENENHDYYQDIDDSQYVKTLSNSILLDNGDEVENYICQVEIFDEKQTANLNYGKIMLKKGMIYFSLKNQSQTKNNPICSINFLLKTEKIWNELNNLLHNHSQNKSLANSDGKILIKDRRLTSIEQSMKCQFSFPNNMKVFRYKGNNCIRMRISSTNDLINLQALNLFRIKIPKLYNECIFTEQILNYSNSGLDFKSTKYPIKQPAYLIERPITELYNRKYTNFYNNYSAPLNSTASWN